MTDYTIKDVRAREIFDSRANPTVEVDVVLACGSVGRGMVPAGASTGAYEALELRDKDRPEVFGGKGVQTALKHVRGELRELLIGRDASRQAELDRLMIDLDGTPNKSRLGANAILGCSLAIAHAAAGADGEWLYRYLGGASAGTLPLPMIQIIGGGAHALDTVDVQDYLVMPLGARSFREAITMVVDVYNAAKKVFVKEGKPLAVADEGGLWPTGFRRNEEGLELLTRSIESAGYRPMKDVAIALDVASSEFYDKESGSYELRSEGKRLSREDFVRMLERWAADYPIISIEDGCAEDDWLGHRMLTEKLGSRMQLIGDDLFTTNVQRIREGIEQGACNAVLIKMNQIGTITETIEAIAYTRNAGMLPVVSARSGETEDTTIAHLALATNAGQLKVGSIARSERNAKWNEMLRIEDIMGPQLHYASRLMQDRFGLA